MIGYGSMLVESFTAVIALIAAITISQGVYFSTNMSAAQITAASGVSISATSTPGEQADAAVKAVESMKVSDIEEPDAGHLGFRGRERRGQDLRRRRGA